MLSEQVNLPGCRLASISRRTGSKERSKDRKPTALMERGTMIGKIRALRLGGASMLAIAAASALAPSPAYSACVAVSPGGIPSEVNVVCGPGDPDVAPFTTAYSAYNGNGVDTLTMTGGFITDGAEGGPPQVIGSDFFLTPSDGIVDMLGGNDVVNIQGGQIGTPEAPVSLSLGDGTDTFNMSGGTLNGSVFGGAGDDDIEVSGNAIITGVPGTSAAIETGAGNSEVRILGGTIGADPTQLAIFLEDGANIFEMSGGAVSGNIVGQGGGNNYTLGGGVIDGFLSAGSGNDTVLISGGTITGEVSGEGGNDTISVSGGTVNGLIDGIAGNDSFILSGGQINGSVEGSDGNDTFLVSGAVISGDVAGGDGADVLTVSSGSVSGGVFGNAGDDALNFAGGTIAGPVTAGAGNDVLAVSGGTVNSSVTGEGGADQIVISDGSIGGFMAGGAGNDTLTIVGGSISSDVFGDDGADVVTVSGGSVSGGAFGNAGDDALNIGGGTIAGNVSGDDGNDQISISGGSVGDDVNGGTGNDILSVSGGTIAGSVSGDEGTDNIAVSGGTISGNVSGETVTLTGGSVGGDFFGITGNTLIINDPGSAAPINLANGVLFSGTNAVGSITDTDLAAGGSKTQVFSGFDSVTASNSTLAFSAEVIDIGTLTLTNGSTLFVNGNVDPDTLNVFGSTINMIDGAPDDVLTLGGLALNNATIGLDINQQTLQADQIVADTLTAAGTNVVNVNLLGTPTFTETTDIPIIVTGGPVTGNFVVTGIPGTPGSLFIYQVFAGPGGGLFIRAIPAGFGLALAPQNAVDVSTVETAIDALYGINDDAIDADLGLANGAQRIQITPTFGVFASGQLAHTEHDGFDISSNSLTIDGPGFGADDFSAAISLDFNVAKHFGFEDQYGLNLGLFGGYASTDVGLGAFQGFNVIGDANNKSGMVGGYGLFRSGFNYLLVSATAFLGETDVFNGVLNTSGSYDTEGYAVTGSVGHIFVLSDSWRFDLRGGLLGVVFNGGDYTDSGGNQFGKSEISFGAVKLEPGIYTDMQLENGMVFSPYARADLQQRFGYQNTSSISGIEIEFDDADFSAALSTGFNLKMTKTATLSGEVRGKLSSDSSTIAGKLGLKIAF
jgi:hypothetical protein